MSFVYLFIFFVCIVFSFIEEAMEGNIITQKGKKENNLRQVVEKTTLQSSLKETLPISRLYRVICLSNQI